MGSLTRWYALGMGLCGLVVAWLVLAPYQSVSFTRTDGEQVELLNPSRLNDTSDIWDYLQLGRNLYHGHGFKSYFTYVPFLPESVPEPEVQNTAWSLGPRFPMLWRQPGYPVLIASVFAVTGDARPNAVLWLNGLAIVLLPVVTYGLGRVFLTPGWAALAGLWALLSPAAVGMPSPLVATCWFSVLLVLLVTLIQKTRSPVGWVATGVVLGLLVLFRLETWILAPGLLVLHARLNPGRRVVSLGLVTGVALLVVLPWQLRLFLVTGTPFYNASSLIYHGTDSFPGWDSSRTLAVRELTPLGFVMSHWGEVLAKTGLNLVRFLRDLVLLPSPFLAPLLWWAVLRGRTTPSISAYFYGGMIAVGSLILILAPMEYSSRFLAPVVPLLAVGAAMGMARLARFRRSLALGAIAIGLLLLGLSLTGRNKDGGAVYVASDLNVLMRTPTGDSLLESSVVLADAPTLYAWIWERHAVWAPVDGVDAVRAYLPGAAAIFTRHGGPDRDREENVIRDYLLQNGNPSSPEEPLLITWPVDPKPVGAGR